MIRVIDAFAGVLETHPGKGTLSEAVTILGQWMNDGDMIKTFKNGEGTEYVQIVDSYNEPLDIYAVIN